MDYITTKVKKMELQNYINDICEELQTPNINKQRSRYLKSHLEDLLSYQKNHPEKTDVPTHLEIFCDLNPDALECRIYNV